MAQLREARELLAEIDRLEHEARDKQQSRIMGRLARKFKAEIKQLEKQGRNDERKKSTSNLPHLKGVLQTVKDSTGVKEVLCDMKKYGIVIDVVCDHGRTWKKVVARNAQATHLIWAGKGQYGTKDVARTIRRYLKSAEQFCEFSPPRVVCVFTNGVTAEMAEYLESLGAQVEGERVDVHEDTSRRLQALEELEDSECELDSSEASCDDELECDGVPSLDSHNQLALQIKNMSQEEKIFLDVTSMVIYISDVCNGGASFEFKDSPMAWQAAAELEAPVMPFIERHMAGKTLVTCDTALENLKEFVDALGGPEEKRRSVELIKRLSVVPDLVSNKFLKLQTGGKIKAKARTIFGTADTVQCEILTSNESFVRAAGAQGVNCAAILHQSRALSELTRLQELAV